MDKREKTSQKPSVNSNVPEDKADFASFVTPGVLLVSKTL
jgi:hypothetical protein